jgi:hypothetical protein
LDRATGILTSQPGPTRLPNAVPVVESNGTLSIINVINLLHGDAFKKADNYCELLRISAEYGVGLVHFKLIVVGVTP